MSSLVKTEPETHLPNVSKLALEYFLDSCSESPVANNVLGLPDGQCIPYRQGTWTAPVKKHGKNRPPAGYVEGTPPPQHYAGPGYASAAANGAPPQGYGQGYYAQPQSVYHAPPPNISRDASTHRLGQRERETVHDDDAFGETFDDRHIRARFIRKVYTILMLQLLVTSAFIAFFVFHVAWQRLVEDLSLSVIANYVVESTGLKDRSSKDKTSCESGPRQFDIHYKYLNGSFAKSEPTKRFVQHNTWVYFLSYALFFVTYIAIVCCSNVRRQYPCNVVMLILLTLSLSIMLGVLSTYHNTYIVLIAFGTTAVVCLLVSIFACQTYCDISGWGMYLCLAGLVISLFGFIALLVAVFTEFTLLILICAGLIALLFSLYLMYDTQQIMGGRKIEISPEEHFYAVTMLYTDVTIIFIAFLTLCGWNN